MILFVSWGWPSICSPAKRVGGEELPNYTIASQSEKTGDKLGREPPKYIDLHTVLGRIFDVNIDMHRRYIS